MSKKNKKDDATDELDEESKKAISCLMFQADRLDSNGWYKEAIANRKKAEKIRKRFMRNKTR